MDRLVSSGLISRFADDSDRRVVCHRITDVGRRAVEELERTGRERVSAILDRLSPEQMERLLLALRDLNEATEAVDAESSTRVVV